MAKDTTAAKPKKHKVEKPADALSLVLLRKEAASKERETFSTRWDRWRKYYVAERTIPTERANRNNVFDAVLFEVAQTQIPRLMQAWFGEKPMFPLRPAGDEDKEDAEALERFLQLQIDANLLCPETSPWVEVDGGVMQYLHYGTMVMQVSWSAKHNRPLIECSDLHEWLFDPMAVRGYKARYAIRMRKITIAEIKKRAKAGLYDQEQVNKLLQGSNVQSSEQESDEDLNPERLIQNMPEDDKEAFGQALKDRARDDKTLDLWEYFEPDRRIDILDGRAAVMDGPSPHELKEIPAWVIPLVPLKDRMYGVGNAEIGEQLQLEINAKANQSLDYVDMILNPPLLQRRSSSFNSAESKFEAGSPWLVDDIDADVKLMNMPNYVLGTAQEREGVRVRLNQALGTTDYTKGQQGSDRVGVVVRLLIEQANARYGMMAQRFFEYAIRPWYRWSLALNLQYIGGDPKNTGWEDLMGDVPNPLRVTYQTEGAKVENISRDLVMPATYYTGSKALRAQNFRESLKFMYEVEPLAMNLNHREVALELFKLDDIPGVQRLMTQQNVGEEQQVEDENERLMLGETIAPRAGENHQLHLEGHMPLVAALDQVLTGMDQDLARSIETALTAHIRGTQLLAEQEMQEQAGGRGAPTGAPPGPAPGPGPALETRESEPVMDLERRAAGSEALTQ
jgi:hypothetical protein